MSRIRTVKPEFWAHEGLSALPEPTHMLAGALLNYADDEGYFNANPALVKAACSPLREPSVSIPTSLRNLQAERYIRLGTAKDGKRYGQIVNFGDHQVINRKSISKIKDLSIVWDCSVIAHTQITEPSQPEGKGREQGMEVEGKGTGIAVASLPVTDPSKPFLVETLNQGRTEQAALDAYNDVAAELRWPAAKLLTPQRKSGLRNRLAECGGIEGWNAAMAKARASPFLRGESGRDKAHEKWVPDLDFFLQQKSFVNLMEGKYDNRDSNQTPTGFGAIIAGARAAASG